MILKSLRTLVIGLVTLVASSASGQDGFDIQRFAPSLDGSRGFWSVPAGSTADRLQWGVSGRLHYGSRPFVADAGGADVLSIVEGQLQLDVTGFVGITDWLEVGVGLPVIVLQGGDPVIQVLGTAEAASGGGLGDPRVAIRGQILGPVQRVAPHGFDLSLGVEARLPVGNEDKFQGDQGLRIHPFLASEYSLSSGIRTALQVGYQIREEATIGDLEVDDELTWALAASVPLGEFAVMPELSGGIPFGTGETSMEVRLGVRYAISEFLAFDIGGGVGLLAGVGNAGWRVIGGLHYSQRSGNDRDGDGLPNAIDACPNQAEDFDGDNDDDGCPDEDGDPPAEYIDPVELDPVEPDPVEPDPVEPDPLETGGGDSPRRGFGGGRRGRDRDDDGIPDSSDDCPEVAEAMDDPFYDGDGCPTPDSDGDGFLDPADLCPAEAENMNGVADHDGCPDTFEHIEVDCDFIFLLSPVTFEGRTADFSSDTTSVLDEIASVLIDTEATAIRIEAHTDSEGEASENFSLTQERAEAVLTYLRAAGVTVELSASGMGEEMPIAGNATEEERAENRRIEFYPTGGCF